MKSYHVIESKIDINQLFYSNDIETGQMSGCISLAYRAITQKNLPFFLEHKDKLFGEYDTKFGIDMSQNFTYTGDEHYRCVYCLPILLRDPFLESSLGRQSNYRKLFVLRQNQRTASYLTASRDVPSLLAFMFVIKLDMPTA